MHAAGAAARPLSSALSAPSAPRPSTPIRQGLLLLLYAVGWQLRLRAHLWVQAVGLLHMLALLPARCAADCANPGWAALYRHFATWLAGACGGAFPITVAARRDTGPPFPCLMGHAWLLVRCFLGEGGAGGGHGAEHLSLRTLLSAAQPRIPERAVASCSP